MTDTETTDTVLLDMTVGIVANYVSNNRVQPDEVATLITSVHASLSGVGSEPVEEPATAMTTAEVRKLITKSGIKSLIDGRVFKSMKRHVTTHGYTPETYREAFGLPADFPMVHPDYSKARSAFAKLIGLGAGGRAAKKTTTSKA